MTCIKAQSMIIPFINNKLTIKELEEFLDHVGSCSNCMEELEFYYTLLTGMKQLDEDKKVSNDFRQELSGKIKKSRERIQHAKFTYYRKITILILFMILLAFLLGISYAEESEVNRDSVSKSNFRIRYSFSDYRFDNLDKQLEDYLNSQQDQEMITVSPTYAE